MTGTPTRVTIALASIGAAIIHFVVTPEHLEEFALFGVFFLLLGIFQALWAGAALLKPNAAVLLVGVVASAAVVAIWVVSRTAGLPIGPEAGSPEPVDISDAVASGLELLIVLGGTVLLLRRATPERRVEVTGTAEEERRAA